MALIIAFWHLAKSDFRAIFNRTFGFGLVITEINEQSGCGVADA
jgi:hypothetical protein